MPRLPLSEQAEDWDKNLEPTPARPSFIAFPALRNLILHDINFAGRSRDLKLSLLKQCLISRSRQDVGILTLALKGCKGISSEDVAQLKELVSHVELDGESE